MNNFIIAWVALFFSGYVFFDSMAVLSRMSAAKIGLNAFGSAIEKIMNTLKRLSAFSFPPALGFFVVSEDINSLSVAVFVCAVLGAFVLLSVIFYRSHFDYFFVRVAKNFDSGKGILRSFSDAIRFSTVSDMMLAQTLSIRKIMSILADRRGVFLTAAWVYFVFSSTFFLINFLALRFLEAAPIILQSIGFFNGLGTLALAFLVDPKISRNLDKGTDLEEVSVLILLSQLFAIAVLMPSFFLFWIIFV